MAPPSEAELAAARASGIGRSALGPLPEGYPAPRFRLVLQDVNVRYLDKTPIAPGVRIFSQHTSKCGHMLAPVCCVGSSTETACHACKDCLPMSRDCTRPPGRAISIPESATQTAADCTFNIQQVTVALAREPALASAASSGSSRGALAADGGEASRLELDLTGLCLQMDEFGSGGQHARRVALSVHHIEVRQAVRTPVVTLGFSQSA